MKLSQLQDAGCSPPGTHPHSGGIFRGVQSLGTPSPEQPPHVLLTRGVRRGMLHADAHAQGADLPAAGREGDPAPCNLTLQAPKHQQQGSLSSSSQPQHLLKNDSLESFFLILLIFPNILLLNYTNIFI